MNLVNTRLPRSRWLVVRHLQARPRLFISLAIGFISYFLIPEPTRTVTKLLIAWNLGTLFFLISVGVMMARATHQNMRHNAILADEGQNTILTFAMLAAIACLAAIIVQLGLVKNTSGVLKTFHVALAFATIVTAWAFIHVMFALHYAHEYFVEWRSHQDTAPQLRGGLEIIGLTECPDYYDFAYYAFTIGVANATADINITSPQMRRITLVHSVLAFFFNMALLGLTINIAAGLI